MRSVSNTSLFVLQALARRRYARTTTGRVPLLEAEWRYRAVAKLFAMRGRV